jgi:mannose-6-phosphate isomerase-like protein (cupin superfamily)
LDALTRLSGDAQIFCEKIWGRSIHVHRSDVGELSDLLSLADVDTLVTSSGLRTPTVRLAQDGAVLPSSRYTRTCRIGGVAVTGLVDGRKVLDLFAAGATVILQGLHRYWPPLAGLVAELEDALGHPCQANAYLTPADAQGFARHRDTHDVFVLQIDGDKQWEVEDDAGLHQVLMEPGMCMYLPTGTPHSARAQTDASLHITVGINRILWSDVLTRAARLQLSGAGIDEPLPAGYHRDSAEFARAVEEHLGGLRAAVAALDSEHLAASETARFQTTRTASLKGGLVDRIQLGSLDDHTTVRRRHGSVLAVVPDGDRLRVLLGDREMRVPGWLGPALTYVEDNQQLSPADLGPLLDPESRLVLVRRLVREGLLEVAR